MSPSPKFCSPEGREIVTQILKSKNLVPHDDQLTCVCHLLDAEHVLGILPTNAGKTMAFIMFMICILALKANPQLHPTASKKIPANAAMIVIVPTVGLAEEMEVDIHKIGLRAVAITAESISAAAKEGKPSPWTRAAEDATMLLMSPEQLGSTECFNLLKKKVFSDRMMGLGIDEIHLIDTWGKEFRKAFEQISIIRQRLPSRVVTIAVTGTLMAGGQTERVCHSLGLRTGEFFLLRRSNIRHDIKVQFKTLTHGLGGDTFEDLRYIVEDEPRRRCIIFCPTIRLAFTVLAYLWEISPTFPPRDRRFLFYTAVNWNEHNKDIRQRMCNDRDFQVLLATDAFSVGLTIPGIADVHILGLDGMTLNKLLQMLGRADRDYSVPDACGVVHLPPRALEAARKLLADAADPTKKMSAKEGQMEVELAMMIVAILWLL